MPLTHDELNAKHTNGDKVFTLAMWKAMGEEAQDEFNGYWDWVKQKTEALPVVQVETIHVKTDYVRCPHCDEQNDGWLSRPNPDTVQDCTSCGGKFKVAADAEVKFND